jgi:hypothetical protein
MLGRMGRLAIVGVLLALVVQAEARPGKVVRVERKSSANIGTPRYCTLQPPELKSGWCFGPKVEVGEVMTIVAPKQAAALRIKTAQPYPNCNQAGPQMIWQVEGETEGDAKAIARNPYGTYVGVVDGGLDWRRSRLVAIDASVSGRATDLEPAGFDRDGDGRPDLAFDHYTCDAQGNPSQMATANCYEFWADNGHGWKRVRVDVVGGC